MTSCGGFGSRTAYVLFTRAWTKDTLFAVFFFLLEGLHDLTKETKVLNVNVASQDIHLNNTEPKIAVSDLRHVSFKLSEQVDTVLLKDGLRARCCRHQP